MPPENGLVAQATHRAMGTVMTHRAFGRNAGQSLGAVRRDVERIEGLLSRFLPHSEVSRINGSAGTNGEKVGRETYEVLSRAAEFSRVFPGYFDITIGPLVALWNSCQASSARPPAGHIERARALVNHRDLTLDPGELSAGLKRVGQCVDLGSIGKGFAGDSILQVFRAYGVASAFSNLGGNVVALGTRPDGTPWRIGIQHPRQENRLIGSVSVVDQVVATSGDYRRYFADSHGRRYHHILDPTTGYPAESGLISVSIVSASGVTADALSTVLFVAGIEQGLDCLSSFPQAEAILVCSDLRVCVTEGLRHRFQAAEGVDVTILR